MAEFDPAKHSEKSLTNYQNVLKKKLKDPMISDKVKEGFAERLAEVNRYLNKLDEARRKKKQREKLERQKRQKKRPK